MSHRPFAVSRRSLFALAAGATTAAVFPAARPGWAQEGTPVPAADDALASMLGLVPPSAGDPDNAQIASFADIALQLAAVGATAPASLQTEDATREAWVDAIFPLAIASPFREFAFRLDRSLIGFELTDVDQTLEAGQPPEMVTFLRGRFDRAALTAAWQAQGYRMLDVDGVPVASLAEDASFELSNDLQRIALARWNNAALLPDGTLAYAPTLAAMTEIVAIAKGEAPSLADRVDVATLLATLETPLASAVLFSGGLLGLRPSFGFDPAASPEAMAAAMATEMATAAAMPPVALGVMGITPGGPLPLSPTGEETPDPGIPAVLIQIRLLMAQPGSAETAAEVVSGRLETMASSVNQRPYREFFASWDASAVGDGQVLRLELALAPGTQAGVWTRFLFANDLGFLAW